MPEMTQAARRKMWRPKVPELPVQCASCPFREGNDAEFAEYFAKLRKALAPSNRAPVRPHDLRFARFQIKIDLHHSGDFICHYTAYTPEMKKRPASEYRQCPGASAFFRGDKT